MSEQSILYAVADGIARVTLNRADKLNSFNDAMHAALREAIASAMADQSVRALLLTGAGRGFCAGQDLGESIERNYKPLITALRTLPFPAVCAVNGVAAGAGANLALACDLVVATRSASFIQAFSKIGLIPDSGGTYFLPRLVGRARALGLAMLGDKLSADDAAAWGLIWRSVDDADFAATVDKLCMQHAGAPTRALVATRMAIDAAGHNALDVQLDLERDLQRELGFAEDYREGVAAFTAKRAPRFTGR